MAAPHSHFKEKEASYLTTIHHTYHTSLRYIWHYPTPNTPQNLTHAHIHNISTEQNGDFSKRRLVRLMAESDVYGKDETTTTHKTNRIDPTDHKVVVLSPIEMRFHLFTIE